jgi:hypothetical protein
MARVDRVRDLRRIDLYCPEYKTNATLLIVEDHDSGQPHLAAHYENGGLKGQMQSAAAIPAHWSDNDLLGLIFLPFEKRQGRDWPTWEVPARYYGSKTLFKFWKGGKPLRWAGDKLR